MKHQWYNITDIDLFIEATRVLVYTAFGDSKTNIEQIALSINDLTEAEKQEIEYCLSSQETLAIAKEYLKKTNKNKLYKISDKAYMNMLDSLHTRLVSNLLHKLSNDGILDSAFDEELNDFVFWTKDEDSTTDNH